MNAIAVLGFAFALVALGHVIRLHRLILALQERVERVERERYRRPADSTV